MYRVLPVASAGPIVLQTKLHECSFQQQHCLWATVDVTEPHIGGILLLLVTPSMKLNQRHQIHLQLLVVYTYLEAMTCRVWLQLQIMGLWDHALLVQR